jgi:AraC-like DNA-binding protein
MKQIQVCAVIVAAFLVSLPVWGQDGYYPAKKDSLRHAVDTARGADRLEAYSRLVGYIFYAEPPESLLEIISAYEKEALRQGDRYRAGACRGNIISARDMHTMYDQLFERADADLAFIAEQETWNFYFKAYEAIVKACFKTGQKEKAMEYAQACFAESKSINAIEAKVWPLYILGCAYLANRRDSEAQACFEEAIRDYGGEEKCAEVVQLVYMELCQAYGNQDKREELGVLLQEWQAGIDRLDKAGKDTRAFRLNSYFRYARYYLAIKDFDAMEHYCSLLDSLASNLPDFADALNYYRQEAAMALGDYDSALGYARKKYRYALEKNNLYGQYTAIRDQTLMLIRLGNTGESVEAFNQTLLLHDSISGLDINRQIDELRTKYETDKHIAQTDKQRLRFLFALAACALLAVALGIWIYYNRKIARRNRVLAEQIKELVAQQELRQAELINKSSFLDKDELLLQRDAGDLCPENRKDKLCLAIRNIILKEKAYLNPTLTRDYVIEQLGTNRNLFIDAFQSCFGMSFTDYINNLRLKDAVTLLEQSDLPVEEISRKTGFGTIRTFQRQFQKKYDLSPKDYRYSLKV